LSSSIPKQVREFNDEIPSSNKHWTELGRPSREDFERKRVAVRDDLVERVLKELETKHFCVISGPRDSGKTWLCRAIAVELKRRNESLKFVELDLNFNPNELWTYIGNYLSHFFIVENCHINRNLVEDFVTKVLAQPRNRRFIFTTCDARALSILEDEACWIRLKTGSETTKHIEDIIRKFVEVEKVKEWVDVTDEEIKATAEKWSDGDLHDVYVRLTQGWRFKEKRTRVPQIDDKEVFESMLDVHGKLKLGLPERREIFLPLSAICQFESAQVWDEYLQRIGQTNELRELENEGLIERNSWLGNFFFRIEPGKASWILRAIAYQKGSEYVRKEIMKTFKDYITQRPPNWTYVIYCARVSKEAPILVKEIPYETKLPPIESLMLSEQVPKPIDEFLHSVFEDQETWKAIKEMVETRYFFSLSLLPSISKTLIAGYQAEKEQDIVRLLLQKETDQMLHELSSSDIWAINDFLSFLWKRDWARFKEVAKKIDVRDSKLAKYEESTVQSKCTLCFIISYANISMSDLIVEDIQKQLKDGTTSMIRKALPGISRIDRIITLDEFFDSFTTADWERIIKNSTLLATFRLFATDFRIRHLQKTSVQIAQIVARSDLTYLVRDKNAGLYALRGVINAAIELNVETGALVESIICTDEKTLKSLYSNEKKREALWSEGGIRPAEGAFLVALSGILMRAINRAKVEPQIKLQTDQRIASFLGRLAKFEAGDLREIFRDAESVNYFFPHLSWKAPDVCRSIIRKIGFDAWFDLLQSTLRQEKPKKVIAFWLLWNVFRYDESLAKRLAEKSADIFSENVKNGRLSEVSLPLTGLLRHLKVNIDSVFEGANLERAYGILDSYRNRKPLGHSTLILLSLVALSSKAPRDKFEALKGEMMKDPDVESSLYRHWDTQLQSVFDKLIHDYGL
jgi:hypothetical protein